MKQKKQHNRDRPMSDHYFAEAIANRTELHLIHTPSAYAIDFALVDRFTGDVAAWLEVICEKGVTGSDFLFCLQTWMKGLELSSRTGKPFILGFRKDDNDYLLEIGHNQVPLVLVDIMNSPEKQEDSYSARKAYVRIPVTYFHAVHAL